MELISSGGVDNHFVYLLRDGIFDNLVYILMGGVIEEMSMGVHELNLWLGLLFEHHWV